MSRKQRRVNEEKNLQRINNVQQADMVRKRIEFIMRHCNIPWSKGCWRSFEAMMSKEIPLDTERQKVLKRLFSKWGSAILAADGRYVEIIENKLNIKHK